MRLLVARYPSLPIGASAANTRVRPYDAAASLKGLCARRVTAPITGASSVMHASSAARTSLFSPDAEARNTPARWRRAGTDRTSSGVV